MGLFPTDTSPIICITATIKLQCVFSGSSTCKGDFHFQCISPQINWQYIGQSLYNGLVRGVLYSWYPSSTVDVSTCFSPQARTQCSYQLGSLPGLAPSHDTLASLTRTSPWRHPLTPTPWRRGSCFVLLMLIITG